MPKYWGKQILRHGRFPKWVKSRSHRKKEKIEKKVGENNGQLCFVRHHGWRTQARLDQKNILTSTDCIYTATLGKCMLYTISTLAKLVFSFLKTIVSLVLSYGGKCEAGNCDRFMVKHLKEKHLGVEAGFDAEVTTQTGVFRDTV